jgi:2-oxoglutarate dehydrogenase E1 component
MSSDFKSNSYLYGTNETYLAQMFARYLQDPRSVGPEWLDVFQDLGEDEKSFLTEQQGASWAPRTTSVIGGNGETPSMSDATAGLERPKFTQEVMGMPYMPIAAAPEQIRQATMDSIRALMLIRNYRVRGHLHSKLDPLGIVTPLPHSELDPVSYGFTNADMDRPIFINYVLGLESATLRQIVKILEQTYCGKIGVEFMHIQEPEEKAWIQERIEGIRNRTNFTDLGRRTILERLTQAEVFEQYLDRKYTGAKRFGLDGSESTVPLIEQIFKRAAQLGVDEVIIGMPHRGRINLLANIMRKPYRAIFSEFQGNTANPEDMRGSGDVKYHLGTSADRDFDGNSIHLSLTANPSHLEAVNTVVLGKVRAKQRQKGDEERERVFGLLLHGDAAFAGQGIVPETLDLSQLRGYRTGGTIHLVVNNQIGFTTNPTHSRSGPYCSDVAKIVSAPILHVNGDDPEACVHTARIAMEYRQRFKKDIVIDMWCYRRHGHNESDEPAFTQPIMYKKIKEHPTTRALYGKHLEDEGLIEKGEADQMVKDFRAHLDSEYEAATGYKPNKADWLESRWAGMELASGDARRGDTGVELSLLHEVGYALSEVPQNFNVNSKIVRQLNTKRKMIESGEGIDWATAEALGLGTLLCESTPVRLSGEDSQRGTFSQRHAVLIDQTTEERHIPLNNIRYGQAPFEIIDSPLSEFGVLGFEYGYSLAEPHSLVIWEAQFGDFANGAQVIIDQFISSGESKWLRMSGLVLLLPHGYEGQGPEHSSAKLERYLQLCAEDNMQVVNLTTPSNYFHVLRRQMRREFRKPLIIMTPKSLLRHKRCVSSLNQMENGTTFHRVLWDERHGTKELNKDENIRRVVLCSGKVYYDLVEERDKRQLTDIFIMRLEQLYPFPEKALTADLAKFKNAEFVWCQEEPRNMGAWFFIRERVENVLEEINGKNDPFRYVGRPEAASPATGSLRRHNMEQENLVNEALSLPPKQPTRKTPAKKPARKRRP